MNSERNFSLELKRRVVEELLSGKRRPAQLYHRYNITSSVMLLVDEATREYPEF